MPTELSGRRSLARLIGKRRRTLSPHLAQLLNPQNAVEAVAGEGSAESSSVAPKEEPPAAGEAAAQMYESECVSCPVCGSAIRGTDHSVNSHLDMCLAKGAKRRLTQRTLIDLRFHPISSSKLLLGDSKDLGRDLRQRDLDDEIEASSIHLSNKYDSVGNSDGNHCTSTLSDHSSSNLKLCTETSLADKISEDVASCKVVNPCGDAELLVTLETFIVGRKFHENAELQEGATISISREPENANDSHAIKVVSADSGRALGYLPRELAKYLSTLIDKHSVRCKGSVASLPKNPIDAVPIQLICQKTAEQTEMESNNHQNLRFLLDSCLHVAEYAKLYPPGIPKYQRNFCILIKDVLHHHAHLFTDDEKLFLGSFQSLSDDGQRLFIRLYTRKGPWFRMSNISYSEITNSQRAVEELQLAGYFCSFHSSEDLCRDDLKEVLDVLTVVEMQEIINLELSKNGIKSARRQELVNILLSAYEDGRCPLLPVIVLKRAGNCVKISSSADFLLWRVQRLFFLNSEQNLSAFLLVDLGLIKFPVYNCNISQPIFHSRVDLLAYEEAIEVAQIMDQSLDENNVELVNRCIDVSDASLLSYFEKDAQSSAFCGPPTFFSHFTASWVYSKVISLGVSFFEHDRRYDDAIRLLKGLLSRITCDSRRGHWTLRLSIDLEHKGRPSESLSVAEEGLLDPWIRSGPKVALQRRVLRLGKPPRRWKMPNFAESVNRKIKEVNITGRPITCKPGTKSVFYGYDGELCGVEQLALQYYAGEGGGWQGVHSESGIWMNIFGLLMWDVIFSDVPDVFRSRFQMAPLDLTTDNFYVARKSLIESHIQKIYEGHAEEILIASWESHLGTACRGVNWDRHSLSDLRATVSCIGGHCLASFCRHLALDYGSWSSGMPDLLLWRFHGGERNGGEAKLVEVKGPKDQLSEQQRAWLLCLMDCGFDAEVCKVSLTFKS